MVSALLTTREVAEHFRVCPDTVLRWVRAGKLRAFRLPSGAIRFREDDLDAQVAEWATPSRGVSPAPKDAAQRLPYSLSPGPEVEE
jgi:excisionase family DNA binding protein